MCNDEVTPYVRPPSTRKVFRGLQALYLNALKDTRLRREALLELRRQNRVLTLDLKIMRLTRGHTKDAVYQEKVKIHKDIREDIRVRDTELSDKNKALRSLKVVMKAAATAHLETRLALLTPELNTAFTNLSILRGDSDQRGREYREAKATYHEAQRVYDESIRVRGIAERDFQSKVAVYHSYMKGRVRKKTKNVAQKGPEVQS